MTLTQIDSVQNNLFVKQDIFNNIEINELNLSSKNEVDSQTIELKDNAGIKEESLNLK